MAAAALTEEVELLFATDSNNLFDQLLESLKTY